MFSVTLGSAQTPGSPGPLSMSGLSISSPGSSPQLGSPGHMPLPHHPSQSTLFGFNQSSIGAVSMSGLSTAGGSPGAPMPPPPSPSHVNLSQPPPPLPPRSHRRRESSISESPHLVKYIPLYLNNIYQ